MADNTALKPVILESDQPVFAVLDGAQFDDLPSVLFEADFTHRPLYLDRGNGTADQLRTAPQLVWLDQDRKLHRRDEDQNDTAPLAPVLERLLDLVDQRPALVFWVCEAGGETLYRHLRGINKVLHPKTAYMGRDIEIPESGFEMVTFRHADANVMVQISMSFDWNSLSRLLGPTDAILFAPDMDWNAKPMRVQRHYEMPPPYNGALRIGRNELQKMARSRFAWVTRRTLNYLNEYVTEQANPEEPAKLKNDVEHWLREGQALEMTEESAFRKWCYLQLLHGGQLMKSQFFHDFKRFRDTAVSADERVHQMMKYMIERAEAA